jgi:hypothetical protein
MSKISEHEYIVDIGESEVTLQYCKKVNGNDVRITVEHGRAASYDVFFISVDSIPLLVAAFNTIYQQIKFNPEFRTPDGEKKDV